MVVKFMSEPFFRLRGSLPRVSRCWSTAASPFPAAVLSVRLPLSVQAAPVLQNAGSLGNQLRQEESRSVHIPELAAPDAASSAETAQPFRDASSERVILKHIRLSGAPSLPAGGAGASCLYR